MFSALVAAVELIVNAIRLGVLVPFGDMVEGEKMQLTGDGEPVQEKPMVPL